MRLKPITALGRADTKIGPAGKATRAFIQGLLLLGCAAFTSAAWANPPILAERFQVCISCHGTNGLSTSPETPNLAKLQPRYFIAQMHDFKSGKRKSPLMGSMLTGIDEKDFEFLANYFREQPPPPPGKGDAKLTVQGKEIFLEGIVGSAVPACSGCHRDDGTGTNKYPRLAGQPAKYITQQMLNYKSGVRDNDERGVMRAVAQRMTEAEIRAVAEFIVTMKGDEE
jgi:cytochrome c553